MPPFIHESSCKKCFRCVEACQSDVFFGSMKGEIPQAFYPEECWHCNACVLDCPAHAVELRLPLNYMVLHVDADTLHA